ncbi:MAG: hypothetical protein C0606_16850 [Hyphomicrobiales bacterium]|nr:MAG: hypothetical protein C0606_16850 [Hyphomicrobiales bacterium]
MRYALYFTPSEDDPLTRRAAAWIGRDAYTNRRIAQTLAEGVSADLLKAATASPRRYGFHATLKAPFRLADGESEDDLMSCLTAFCERARPFELGPLAVARLGRFYALMQTTPGARLASFAGELVELFDRFRAPLADDEIVRRNPEDLTERQRQYLRRWGYPYVFDEFRFHMTLTGSLDEVDAALLEPALKACFAPVLGKPVPVTAVTLFVESKPGEPFVVAARVPLAGAEG